MMALLKRLFQRRHTGDTEKLKTLDRYQQGAVEERRRLEAYNRELSIIRGDHVSLRKPSKAEG